MRLARARARGVTVCAAHCPRSGDGLIDSKLVVQNGQRVALPINAFHSSPQMGFGPQMGNAAGYAQYGGGGGAAQYGGGAATTASSGGSGGGGGAGKAMVAGAAIGAAAVGAGAAGLYMAGGADSFNMLNPRTCCFSPCAFFEV